MEINEDYGSKIDRLENAAVSIFKELMRDSEVHSVRYRIKDPEHLIEKIIRKKIENPERTIDKSNYQTEITDLIGLRVLHLFKEQWLSIHNVIIEFWDLHEQATANFREGDNADYKQQFEDNGCDLKENPHGYRSVHYIIKINIGRKEYLAEIQTRTIFEEAWGEIDHKIRYPYDLKNLVFGNFLSILNRLAGSADEMGSFILLLQNEFRKRDEHLSETKLERDEAFAKLEKMIKESGVGVDKRTQIQETIDDLKRPIFELMPFHNWNFQLSEGTLEFLKSMEIVRPLGGIDAFKWDSMAKALTRGINQNMILPMTPHRKKENEEE